MDFRSEQDKDKDGAGSGKLEEFYKQLKELEQDDRRLWFDKDEVDLTADEKRLDSWMQIRREEFRKRYDKKPYPLSRPFYQIRSVIEHDPLLSIFKEMPKGGNLHIHTGACGDINRFFDQLLMDRVNYQNIYIYLGPQQKNQPYGTLFYLTETPMALLRSPAASYYMRLTDAIQYNRVTKAELIDLFTLTTSRIEAFDDIWEEFHNVLYRISTILNVRWIFQRYYEDSFRFLIADQIDYVELRLLIRQVLSDNNNEELKKLYGLEYQSDTRSDEEIKRELVDRIYRAYQSVRREHPQFKLKVIISGSRTQSPEDVKKILQLTDTWMKEGLYGSEGRFIIGFDLVSEEDHGNETKYYAETILEANTAVSFYFHDGETDWPDNTNLYSAYLLGSRRIGHGINLYNFPHLLEHFIEKGIALEVCPVSNQLLRYVSDLRTHPLGEYLRRGVPCVIASDDPQLFNYTGSAYDFWVVYYALFIDLKAVKRLIRNSYLYSGMEAKEKEEKIKNWETKWTDFVTKTLRNLKADQDKEEKEIPQNDASRYVAKSENFASSGTCEPAGNCVPTGNCRPVSTCEPAGNCVPTGNCRPVSMCEPAGNCAPTGNCRPVSTCEPAGNCAPTGNCRPVSTCEPAGNCAPTGSCGAVGTCAPSGNCTTAGNCVPSHTVNINKNRQQAWMIRDL